MPMDQPMLQTRDQSLPHHTIAYIAIFQHILLFLPGKCMTQKQIPDEQTFEVCTTAG